MKWPRKLSSLRGDGAAGGAGGLVVEQPVAHVDLFATAVAAATEAEGGDAAPPTFKNSIDGVSLIPFIEAAARNEARDDPDPKSPSRAECFWRSGEYKSLHYLDRYKLQSSQYPKKEWLFDLREDPTEQNNLAEDPAFYPLLAFMRQRLLTEDAAQAPPSWPALSASYVPVDAVECVPQSPEHEYVLWEN
jgi:arylsulfatase A-like enzyme